MLMNLRTAKHLIGSRKHINYVSRESFLNSVSDPTFLLGVLFIVIYSDKYEIILNPLIDLVTFL